MKTEKKDLKKGKFKLTINVEPKDLVSYFKLTYEKLAASVNISGFRPGKAPRKLVEENLGITRLISESLDQIIQQEYFLAVQSEELIPVGPPKITISKYPNWGLEAGEIKSDLVFEAEVEVMPKVELKDYSGVKIKKRKVDEVKKDDVEKVLLHLRRQKATFSEVSRGAKMGDRVEISYDGFLNNVKQDAMTAKNHPIVLGEKTLIPGFEEQVVGMKKADVKEFEIPFPKDYHSKEYAGKKAKFEVTLVDLKEVSLPNVDDEFAASFGHKNPTDLSKAISDSLKQELEAKSRNEMETEAIEKVLPKLVVEVPDGLVEQETSRMLENIERQIQERGLTLDKYLESTKKTLPEIRKEMAPTAEKNVKIGFLLGKIIEEQKFDPQDKNAGKKALEFLIAKLSK